MPGDAPLRVVIMGVSGTGKTSLGRALSARLDIPYVDGDDLHPSSNISLMAAGRPLGDAERWPWLDRVGAVLRDRAPVIVGCSALRRVYRDRLRAVAGPGLRLLHLTGPVAVIADRMRARAGHYMPPALLDSQLATLEPPGPDEAAADLDITLSLPALTAEAVRALRQQRP